MFIALVGASGMSASLSMKSQMAMDTSMEMSMEAQMEMRMLAEQGARLQNFGVNFPNHDEVAKTPTDSAGMLSWLHLISFAFLLKSGAIMSSFMGQMSPLGVIWGIKQNQDTAQYPPFTFFCVFCCGLQWCVYGTFAFVVTRNYGFLILVYANACGVVFGLYYVMQYYTYCKIEFRQRQLSSCAYAAVLSFLTQALVIADVPHTRALLIVGTVSAGLSVMVTAAPLAELPLILKTHDVSSMPKEFVCCQFFCSALWFGCGLLLHDTWILVPNVFGLVLGGFQIFLLVQYGGLLESIKAPFAKGQHLEAKKGFSASYGALDRASETPLAVNGCTGGTD